MLFVGKNGQSGQVKIICVVLHKNKTANIFFHVFELFSITFINFINVSIQIAAFES